MTDNIKILDKHTLKYACNNTDLTSRTMHHINTRGE